MDLEKNDIEKSRRFNENSFRRLSDIKIETNQIENFRHRPSSPIHDSDLIKKYFSNKIDEITRLDELWNQIGYSNKERGNKLKVISSLLFILKCHLLLFVFNLIIY